ncbi:MAG: hypothetical protein M3Q55_13545 [Acidobacteriota bacterium]|nr:hypothetical protein [Acidobacteriota bacterium]
MSAFRFDAWRVAFFAAGALILTGAPRHPRGAMADMLAHHDWFMAHAILVVAYLVLVIGFVMFARVPGLSDNLRRWTRFAAVGAALEAVEMAVHTAASVDAANLAAGHATPVLSTHLNMALVIYPLFGIVLAVFMIKGMRERAIGSPWIVWLGLIAAVTHALVMPLVYLFEVWWAPIFFPMIMLLGLWLVLSAVWLTRVAVTDRLKPVPT